MSADKVVSALPVIDADVKKSKIVFDRQFPTAIGEINLAWRNMSRKTYYALDHCLTHNGDVYCIRRLFIHVINKTNDLVLATAIKNAAKECCALSFRKDNSIKGKHQYYKATRNEELWEEIKDKEALLAMEKLSTCFDKTRKDRLTGLGYFANRALPQQPVTRTDNKIAILLNKLKQLGKTDSEMMGMYNVYHDQIKLTEQRLMAIVDSHKQDGK